MDIKPVLPNKALIGSNMNTSETRRLTCCQNALGPADRSILCQAQCTLNVAFLPLRGNILDFCQTPLKLGQVTHLPFLIHTSMGFCEGYLTIQLNEDLGKIWTFPVFETFIFNQEQSKQDTVSLTRMALIALCLFLNTGWQARSCV